MQCRRLPGLVFAYFLGDAEGSGSKAPARPLSLRLRPQLSVLLDLSVVQLYLCVSRLLLLVSAPSCPKIDSSEQAKL